MCLSKSRDGRVSVCRAKKIMDVQFLFVCLSVCVLPVFARYLLQECMCVIGVCINWHQHHCIKNIGVCVNWHQHHCIKKIFLFMPKKKKEKGCTLSKCTIYILRSVTKKKYLVYLTIKTHVLFLQWKQYQLIKLGKIPTKVSAHVPKTAAVSCAVWTPWLSRAMIQPTPYQLYSNTPFKIFSLFYREVWGKLVDLLNKLS